MKWVSATKTSNAYRIAGAFAYIRLVHRCGFTILTRVDASEIHRIIRAGKVYMIIGSKSHRIDARIYVHATGKTQPLHQFVYQERVIGEIDHIDRIPLNNIRENLRDIPHRGNMLNKRLYKSNKTGVNGVMLHGTSYVVSYTDAHGKGRLRYFSFGRYSTRSKEEAFNLAVKFRKAWDKKAGCTNGQSFTEIQERIRKERRKQHEDFQHFLSSILF